MHVNTISKKSTAHEIVWKRTLERYHSKIPTLLHRLFFHEIVHVVNVTWNHYQTGNNKTIEIHRNIKNELAFCFIIQDLLRGNSFFIPLSILYCLGQNSWRPVLLSDISLFLSMFLIYLKVVHDVEQNRHR